MRTHPVSARNPRLRVLAVFILSAALAPALWSGEARRKFIELGWDIPSTKELRAHWQEMESHAPFDGVMFSVRAQAEGVKCDSQHFWNKQRWKREWFQEALADLKSCKFARFTDNFVRLNATPGDVAWEDDEGWEALAEKAAILAWLMREAGCKGPAIDFEPYGHPLFKFDPALKHTFAETAAVARKRGAQFVQAIAAEFPNAVILTLFANSVNLQAGRHDNPDDVLVSEHYGLLPAFVNGMLDKLPPLMVLVDGCENGYYMDSVAEYLRAAAEMRQWTGAALQLVAPENRARYRAQVQAGFGFYLDMFLNEEGNRYYRGPRNGSRLTRMRENLTFARQAADEYVWVYGEQCRWWPLDDTAGFEKRLAKSAGKGRPWEEALPGVTRAIEWARSPAAAAKAEVEALRRGGTLQNLLLNAGFDEGKGTLPAAWSTWQREGPQGVFSWDNAFVRDKTGSAKAVGVKDGCFLQKLAVKPGESYAVEGACLRKGSSACALLVRWQTENDKWTEEQSDQLVPFKPGAKDWESASGVVIVPEGVGKLVLLLSVHNQSGQDACWFDDVGVYKLGALP
ncbi:MAG: hypothetical protein ABSE73_11450 [Planctomycetota bacterium]